MIHLLGGNGFVGKELQEVLSGGDSFKSYSSSDCNLLEQGQVQKLCTDDLQDGDSVVFLSCLTPRKGKDLATLMKNLRMAENFLHCLSSSGKKLSHVIYISSDAVYPDGEGVITEGDYPKVGDLYALMHFTREQFFEKALASHPETALTILRPVGMYGADSPHNSYGPSRFITQAAENGTIKLFGGGEEKRDHLFVRDFALILKQCLSLGRDAGGVFNVGTGESSSFMDVAQRVVEQMQQHAPDRFKDIKIETSQRQNPITHKYFNNTKLLKHLPGLRFTSMEKGLEQTLSNWL